MLSPVSYLCSEHEKCPQNRACHSLRRLHFHFVSAKTRSGVATIGCESGLLYFVYAAVGVVDVIRAPLAEFAYRAMNPPVIVVHYHELWLKGRNRRFFLRKLALALREGLGGLAIERIEQPGDRFVVRMAEGAVLSVAAERLKRIFGIVYYAVARSVERDLDAICRAAWEEVRELEFSNFAVRAKRSDKRFPYGVMDIERAVGRYLLDKFHEAGRDVRVKLTDPEMTCRVEIPPGPALVYAHKIPGTGGLPANTGGRMMCLLSGGYDSAVAAYLMMKRGAHLSFIHFYSGGGSSGESSATCSPGTRSGPGKLPTHRQALARPVRVDPAPNRGQRSRRLPNPALSPDDAADRRSHRPSRTCYRPCYRGQPRPGSLANAAKHGQRRRCRAHAGVSASRWNRQTRSPRPRSQNRHLRH